MNQHVIADASALDVEWIKADASGGEGNCVELAALPDGSTALRHSKAPNGPAHIYSREEIRAFLAGAKAGEFDHLAQ